MDDRSALLWDLPGRTERVILKNHDGDVQSVAFSADGKTLATIGNYRLPLDRPCRIHFWDVASGKELPSLGDPKILPQSVVFGPDDTTVTSVNNDGSITIWDRSKGSAKQIWKAPNGGFRHIVASPDRKILAVGASDPIVWLIDAASGAEKVIFRTEKGLITNFAFSPDSRTLASVVGSSTIRLWEVETGFSWGVSPNGNAAFTGVEPPSINSIAFSQD
ncbi:hypothetical protein KIH39_08450 [Telmatocola sphagniphila]|uniref:WD40 repeat domain-containing protein n=1 Tax=Telmatocola sphagniphila TaxID=1123043 RepID=A0A8E6EWL8_9BACT|nr:hypothetical protein [Telmatocola sphagniphila]QVL33922.1 hypothetical protein KIH39_08450 [Telmatocola sphagniphila]